MIVLKENEICPYGTKCPYNSNNNCYGANRDRKNEFTCEYVNNGIIQDNGAERHRLDMTGKMKVIMG